MTKKSPAITFIFAVAVARFAQSIPVSAQNVASGSLREPIQSPAANSGGQKKDDFIKPSRPTVVDPADIQKAGVLQLEFGLDASFDAEEFRNQQATPLRLRFAAASRLLLAFQIEAVKSQVDPTGKRMTGVGDTEPLRGCDVSGQSPAALRRGITVRCRRGGATSVGGSRVHGRDSRPVR